MMEYIYFVVYLLSFAFMSAGVVYMAKYRRFQDKKVSDSANAYIFGLMLFTIYVAIMMLDSGKFIVQGLLPGYYSEFNSYLFYLVLMGNLVIVILMSICYLVSVLLLKETKS